MIETNILWAFYGAYSATVLACVYYAHHVLFTKHNLRSFVGLVHLKAASAIIIGAALAAVFYGLRVIWGGDTSEPPWLIALLLFAAYSLASLLWSLVGKVLMRDVDRYIREHGTMPALKLIAGRLRSNSPIDPYAIPDPGIAPEDEPQ